jgi:hypothetical protein
VCAGRHARVLSGSLFCALGTFCRIICVEHRGVEGEEQEEWPSSERGSAAGGLGGQAALVTGAGSGLGRAVPDDEWPFIEARTPVPRDMGEAENPLAGDPAGSAKPIMPFL